MEAKTFDEFALVEVMGHQRYAGRVTEQTIGGASFVRVDVPAVDERAAFTKILGSGSIFCITPCTEEVALRLAAKFRDEPVSRLALPAPARAARGELEEEWDEDDL